MAATSLINRSCFETSNPKSELLVWRICPLVRVLDLEHTLVKILLSTVHISFGQQCPHLEDRYDRQEPHKQIDQREEKSKCADEHRPVKHRRRIHRPRRRQKVAIQTRNDNDE